MRLIFSHIPKTAGTSVRINFAKQFKKYGLKKKRIFVYKRGGDVAAADFPAYKMPEDWSFLVGHISLSGILENPKVTGQEDALFLSFLRDPVDRLISVYNFTLVNPNHAFHQRAHAEDPMIYIRRFARNHRNLQYSYLKSTGAPIAWQYRISTTSKVEETCSDAFEAVTGYSAAPEHFAKPHNVTQVRHQERPDAKLFARSDLLPGVIDELYDINKLDKALFEVVQKAGTVSYNPAEDLT